MKKTILITLMYILWCGTALTQTRIPDAFEEQALRHSAAEHTPRYLENTTKPQNRFDYLDIDSQAQLNEFNPAAVNGILFAPNTPNETLYHPLTASLNDGEWEYIYTYTDAGYLTQLTQEKYSGGLVVEGKRASYTYDAAGNNLSETWEEFTGGVWVNDYRFQFVYDENGRVTLQQWDNWVSGAWENDFRYTLTYDSAGNLILNLGEIWNGTAWENSNRRTVEYDADNHTLSELTENWEGAWVNYSLQNFGYNAAGLVSEKVFAFWVEGAWENDAKNSYTYTARGYLETRTWAIWDGAGWVNFMYYSNTHTSTGNIISQLAQRWESGAWANYEKKEYTYSASEKLLEQVYSRWGGSSWIYTERWTKTYNASDLMVSELLENWGSGNWSNYKKFLYTFDGNGNCTLGESFLWQANAWHPSNGALSIVFNNGASEIFFNTTTVQLTYGSYMSGVDDEPGVNTFALSQNYPNPFNPSTQITYSIPEAGFVALKVYDLLGSEAAVLVNDFQNAGSHEVRFDAARLASGTYFYRLTSGAFSDTKKLMLLK